MSETEYPKELVNAIVKMNVATYSFTAMKEMHELLINFAKGMEVWVSSSEVPPIGLIRDTFETLLLSLNHVKEFNDIINMDSKEAIDAYKAEKGMAKLKIQDMPDLEALVQADPRIDRLSMLWQESPAEGKARLEAEMGDRMAKAFEKLLAETDDGKSFGKLLSESDDANEA